MQIPILIEPIEGDRYRARAGEPFALSAEGKTKAEAMQRIRELITGRIREGAELLALTIAPAALPFPADERYKTDPWFEEFMEAIAENRRREDEAAP
jgi:predicted RNase H-like HicB family nuclease